MADEHAPLKSETASGKMADATRRATARHREVDALQKMRDEMARPLSAAAELQEQIDRMLGPTRELERMQKQLDAINGFGTLTAANEQLDRVVGVTSAKAMEEQLKNLTCYSELDTAKKHLEALTGVHTTAKLQTQLDGLLGSGSAIELARQHLAGIAPTLKAMQEQVDRISGRTAWLNAKEKFERASLTSMDSVRERLEAQLGGYAKAAGLDALESISRLAAKQSLVPQIDPFWARMRDEYASMLPTAASIAEEMRRQHVSIIDGIVAQALRPAFGSASLDPRQAILDSIAGIGGIRDALANPSPELREQAQTVGKKVAAEALTQATPEDALKRVVELLEQQQEGPLKSVLIYFIYPLIVGLVLAFVTPVAPQLVNKWREDSPQGAEKRAAEKVVREAGGKVVLADYRLVTAQPALVVRESPAALGKQMGRLKFGTAVRVVKEESAFTLVEWRGENDTLLAGWVFTRHLKKFK